MASALACRIVEQVENAAQLYHRLVLVVRPPRSGNTCTLRQLEAERGWPRINVNLALSERLLELTARQRALKIARILDDILGAYSADVALLDNVELLFHPELRQNPLRLLQDLSRNRTVVVSWPGTLDGRTLVYATAVHPEHRRYDFSQALIVSSYATSQ